MGDNENDVKMTKSSTIAIASSLGNPDRNFETHPLTQEEIQAVVFTYSKEASRPGLDPELREIYEECIKILEKHLVFH